MDNDDVPAPFTHVIGHVCGVLAVGMAILGAVVVAGAAFQRNAAGFVGGGICIGIAALLLRWAGALTGYWNTQGRLAAPRWTYRALGGMFAGLGLYGLGRLVLQTPNSIEALCAAALSIVGCGMLAWLCRLAARRFD